MKINNEMVQIQPDSWWHCENSWGIKIDGNVCFLPFSNCEQELIDKRIFNVPMWLIIENELESYIMEG